MVKKIVYTGLYFVSLLPCLAIAEQALTLKTLTNYVYQQAPAKLAEQSLQQLSDASQTEASAFFAAPATINLQHFNDSIGSGNGFQEWESTVEMPLWLPGQKRQLQNISRQQAAQIPYYQQTLRLAASARVRQQVWQVMQAAARFKQAETRSQTAVLIQQQIQQGLADDLYTEGDQLLANSHLAMMQADETQAKSQLQQKLKAYHYVTGKTQLPDQVEEKLPAITVISDDHPLLAERHQQIATLRSQLVNTQFDTGTNPSVSFGIKRERWQFGEPFNNSLGLGVSLPLGGETHNQTGRAQINHQLIEIEIARQQLKQQLELTLMTQLDALASQQQQQQLLKQQHVDNQQLMRTQKITFDNGGIDLQGFLNNLDMSALTREKIQLLEVKMQQQHAQINQTLGVSL